MPKRTMLGLPWSENRKRAFEELAREFSKSPTEFGRSILEEVMQCFLPAERLRELGLLAPWAGDPKPSLLLFAVERARSKLSAAGRAEWEREQSALHDARKGRKARRGKAERAG